MTTMVSIKNASRPNEVGAHLISVSDGVNGAYAAILKPGEERTMHVWGQQKLVIEEVPITGIANTAHG